MLHERSNNTASFAENLKFQEKLTFTDALCIACVQLNEKNLNQDTIHFKTPTYRELHERSNKTASFAEDLKFQEQVTLTYALSVKSGKLK